MTTALDPDVRPAVDGAPPWTDARDGHPADPGRLRRLVRGAPDDPPWARPTLLVLLAGTALLYLWGLGASGWANSYYSSAVQAGATSWKAWFFGSLDAGNAITVDKTPGALWVMGLSARLFGVNAWSILVPQALMGVASVAVVYAAVRRWSGHAAGLVAGLVLALTPVAALMFRFDNPDAMMVLLLTCAVYAVVRALESASTRWIAWAGVFVGFAFLAKMLQAFVLLPVLALVYLLAAPTPLRRRLWQTVVLGVTTLVAAGWWVVIVELWPKSSRPYIGGSQDNTVWDLLIGYNGLGRLNGDEAGSVGVGMGQGGSRWGATGWNRLFLDGMGGQISWLLPAALGMLVVLAAVSRRARRRDRTKAAALLWGGWLVVTGLAVSLGQGIIHEYYTVALAPPIGALIGIGAAVGWRRRQDPIVRAVLAAAIAVTASWGYVLLNRTPDWAPYLRPLVLGGGLLAAVAVLALPWMSAKAATALAAGARRPIDSAPAAYSLNTVRTPQRGSIVTAGPSTGFGGGGPGGGGRGGPGGGPAGGMAAPPGMTQGPGLGMQGNAGAGNGGGGIGGLLDASTPSSELLDALNADADSYTWVAATTGANNAAGYQLSTGHAVLAIGGFNGTDPSPTLDQFAAWVRAGRIHYSLAGGTGMGGGPDGGSGTTGSGPFARDLAAGVGRADPTPAARHGRVTTRGRCGRRPSCCRSSSRSRAR